MPGRAALAVSMLGEMDATKNAKTADEQLVRPSQSFRCGSGGSFLTNSYNVGHQIDQPKGKEGALQQGHARGQPSHQFMKTIHVDRHITCI